MTDYKEISRMLTGQWHEVMAMYGIEIPKMKGINSVNHPCPCCGGNDRAHWREIEGRLALYCRSCAAELMKSPEDVIIEVCGISFSELVNNLAEFVNYRTPDDIKKAKQRTKSKPNKNMPTDHKQDHEGSIEFLESCEISDNFKILLRYGVQVTESVPSKGGYPVFPMVNENEVIVNLACISEKGVSFMAGGHSYGSWYKIARCETRNTDGIVFSSSIIKALNHWWKTGQEVRVTFHDMNTLYMVTTGMIDKESSILE